MLSQKGSADLGRSRLVPKMSSNPRIAKLCYNYITLRMIFQTLAALEISGIGVDFLEFMRVIRISRLFKLTRHSTGLKILLHTLYCCTGELLLLIFLLIFKIVIFASMCYFAKRIQTNWATNKKKDFKSIINGFWWAVATMTTVGYRDICRVNRNAKQCYYYF